MAECACITECDTSGSWCRVAAQGRALLQRDEERLGNGAGRDLNRVAGGQDRAAPPARPHTTDGFHPQ